ncbi:hypothetical protein WJ0W_007148 [Paenibacillus melissococcoides]|uniref:Uncharacterized protein n=1 Tax=Paenibacillus melissococcoides TaxID=2912268 RepID=A0ABM9G9X0_9BACL|nr:hypothetical protein [Paenibacillus melissococcoides]CAH8248481.1 hypothetical protein WJ0W_007148 [Paenibacillus melissococcoides]CAH8722094.1 hypothetical protein HTL2_006692 [Paenibacillus melissococcoides]CAH8722123.1 hypothetical protein WDD9_006631 [Paenibacillus melissococcoides]
MKVRKDAYQQEYQLIGEETFQDWKGKWKISHVSRKSQDRYSISIFFWPNPESGLKETWFRGGSTFSKVDTDINEFKKYVKNNTGYTPTKDVLIQLYEHFDKLRNAYLEEDCFHALADKSKATLALSTYFQIALQRYSKNEILPKMYSSQRQNNFEKYLTNEERKGVIEAIKTLNGHAYCEPDDTGYWGKGHTREFRRKLDDEIDMREAKRKSEEYKAKKRKHMSMLDTDIDFRRLVAHAMEAAKDKRCRDEVELVHRLYGYTKDLDAYRKVYHKLSQMMKKYGLEPFNTSYLIELGNEYITKGGMLPVVVAEYERNDKELYFNDYVNYGSLRRRVSRVGRKYVYVDGGYRWEIANVKIDDFHKQSNKVAL